MNVRPCAVTGTLLQTYFTTIGQTIDVAADQKGNALWTTTESGNSTFTIKLEVGPTASTTAFGIYSEGAAATHFEVFPANAEPKWFAIASFDVGQPGRLVVNVFDNNAMWRSAVAYTGVNSSAFGFYVESAAAVGPSHYFYSEDDENPWMGQEYAPQNLVFAATGSSVGSWWLAFQTTPSAPTDMNFADVLIFMESVNGATPARPATWGSIKSLYTPR